MSARKITGLFVHIFFMVAGTLIAVFGSYYAVNTIFAGTERATVVSLVSELSDYYASKPVDIVPVTAVYSVDEDNTITHILIEVLNCEKRKLTYVSIPCTSRFTISESLYRDLAAKLPQIPQVATLSECYRYFGNTGGIDAASGMLADLAGLKIPYSVSLPSSVFETIFLTKDGKEGIVSGFALPALERIQSSRGSSVYSLLSELSQSAYSNFSLNNRLLYLETYDSIAVSDVVFTEVPGENGNASFTIDTQGLKLKLYKAMY